MYFGRNYETFLYGLRGDATLQKLGAGNVLDYPPVSPLVKMHSVQKPFKLMEELVDRFCLPGHLVLDPFCGAGTTLLACIKKGCNAVGFELDENYYKLAVNNVVDALKLKDSGLADQIGKDI